MNLDERLQCFFLTFIACNSYITLCFLIFFLLHLVVIVGIITQQHTFCESAHAFDARSSKAYSEIGTMGLLASSNDCSTGLAVRMNISISFFSKTNEHRFSTLASKQCHRRFRFSFEVSISEYSVNLSLECDMQASCMCFGHNIGSFKERKNESSVDVMTRAYVDLHGFPEPLGALETLRIVFSNLERFIILFSQQ